MRIDAIQCTGHQGGPIFTRLNPQIPVAFSRQNYRDGINPVGKRLPHDRDIEILALLQLVDARKHQGIDHAAMTGEHRMRVRTAYGQRRAVEAA